MTAPGAIQGFLLRWLPGWLLVSVHVVAAKQRLDERRAARRFRRAQTRLIHLGAKPRDGPH